jgi:ABC-type Fe3+ transport system permease subunit
LLKYATLRPVRAEHLVAVIAALALAVLIVLPLASLVWGSVTDGGRPTLEHFREALRGRLYVQALWNSLVLGAWTAALSANCQALMAPIPPERPSMLSMKLKAFVTVRIQRIVIA